MQNLADFRLDLQMFCWLNFAKFWKFCKIRFVQRFAAQAPRVLRDLRGRHDREVDALDLGREGPLHHLGCWAMDELWLDGGLGGHFRPACLPTILSYRFSQNLLKISWKIFQKMQKFLEIHWVPAIITPLCPVCAQGTKHFRQWSGISRYSFFMNDPARGETLQ